MTEPSTDRLTDEQLNEAYERLCCRIRGTLLQAFGYRHARGMTTADLGKRIGMSERAVRGYLFGPYKLTLRVISDLLLGMGVELQMRVEDITPEPEKSEDVPAENEEQPE